jgi:LDH2 family malate/lactate/ureidoglycolate dehydrogenase
MLVQGEVVGPYDPSRQSDVGHFIMAIKPDLFMPLSDFKERMSYLYNKVISSDRMGFCSRR